jgi:hypothetical protein
MSARKLIKFNDLKQRRARASAMNDARSGVISSGVYGREGSVSIETTMSAPVNRDRCGPATGPSMPAMPGDLN